MLSSFLKKLLFARQFFMIDGRIEVLGKKQVMLPSDVISALDRLGTKSAYANVKSAVRKDVEDYAKKLGSSEEGILKNVDDIFGTFGLGKLELVDINFKKKTCILRLHNSPLRHNGKPSDFHTTDAILSGVFSFLFKKDVDAKRINIKSGMVNYEEYVVQPFSFEKKKLESNEGVLNARRSQKETARRGEGRKAPSKEIGKFGYC